MPSRRYVQFSIASLLAITVLVALAVRFWPQKETIVSRVENWSETFWFDNATGIVKRIGTSNIWGECTVISGDGVHCVLRDGSWIKGTTAGAYYSISIQIPKNIKENDVIELRPVPVGTGQNKEIIEMPNGTIIAMQFGNPFSWYLESSSDEPVGTLTIDRLDADQVSILLQIDLLLEQGERLKIDESFTIPRGYVNSPLDSIKRIIR